MTQIKFFNLYVQGGLNMTGTNCALFTHNQSRSYLNHLVHHQFSLPFSITVLYVTVLSEKARHLHGAT
jgi:hypothetical protein